MGHPNFQKFLVTDAAGAVVARPYHLKGVGFSMTLLEGTPERRMVENAARYIMAEAERGLSCSVDLANGWKVARRED